MTNTQNDNLKKKISKNCMLFFFYFVEIVWKILAGVGKPICYSSHCFKDMRGERVNVYNLEFVFYV